MKIRWYEFCRATYALSLGINKSQADKIHFEYWILAVFVLAVLESFTIPIAAQVRSSQPDNE